MLHRYLLALFNVVLVNMNIELGIQLKRLFRLALVLEMSNVSRYL